LAQEDMKKKYYYTSYDDIIKRKTINFKK